MKAPNRLFLIILPYIMIIEKICNRTRKILDKNRPQEFKEFKTQKAIYFFRENELGKNLKVHFNNTIFIVDSKK
ncbi:hypothetical protein [Vagococcus fluvialis]|uniref:hypothetical protein n=1 Tax=Vagococcus fluvialis TaxID=2738 RepID=UPI001D09B737|nr:hypothetical protein [Vagococcus fluvialis]UDM83073.1 hypothetical protein K5K96_03375 [Vagococcus fluvialis]